MTHPFGKLLGKLFHCCVLLHSCLGTSRRLAGGKMYESEESTHIISVMTNSCSSPGPIPTRVNNVQLGAWTVAHLVERTPCSIPWLPPTRGSLSSGAVQQLSLCLCLYAPFLSTSIRKKRKKKKVTGISGFFI